MFICDLLGCSFVHFYAKLITGKVLLIKLMAAISGRTAFWFATFIQWATMFVMYFVKFKMFTILGLFMVPMLIL